MDTGATFNASSFVLFSRGLKITFTEGVHSIGDHIVANPFVSCFTRDITKTKPKEEAGFQNAWEAHVWRDKALTCYDALDTRF